ncbi:hypothetical protein THAOC_26119, partial [Thalassiosira oceanica]
SRRRVVGAETRPPIDRARRAGFRALLGSGFRSRPRTSRLAADHANATINSSKRGLVMDSCSAEMPKSFKNCAVGARGRRSRRATGAEGGDCTIFALRGRVTLAGRACQEKEGGGGVVPKVDATIRQTHDRSQRRAQAAPRDA